ncbi:MAG: DeoR/GlpR transcriptional regulator, partial [Selenomonadaceae bacterium]|nr:DeoR/GlpR transcriptional regulator [Selenomonadaceae bacterium]
NMIDVMLAMAGDEYNRLIFIGGTFSEGKDGFVGAIANREISRYHFDKAFLGIVGADIERNAAMTYTSEDAATKETILKCSRNSYMLLETRKFDKTGNFIYASLSDFSGAVLDKPLDMKQKTFFDQHGLDYM